ncbi:MAG: hypothetical protein JWR02_3020, partial [Mucilaginibacter sp.]|nr:hypothetical protein [Mucilaginibacter sp.]
EKSAAAYTVEVFDEQLAYPVVGVLA